VSKRARSLLILFAVALAVRVAAAVAIGLDGPPLGDERGYALLAESLAAGDGLRLPVPAELLGQLGIPDHPPLRAFRAPLLPLVLAPVAACGGGLFAMRAICLLLGAACAPLLLLASGRLLSERAGFVCALVYACWPPLVHLSLHALAEPLSMALLIPAIGLAADPDRGRRGTALAGVLAGLAILARPSALLPALLLVPATRSRRRGLVLVLGIAMTVTPWLVRNAVVVGSPVLTTNSGVTLVGANCDAAARAKHPGKWLPPDQIYRSHGGDSPDLGMWGWSDLGEVASSSRFVSHAVRFATTWPGRWIELIGWKLVRLFDPDTHSQKPDAWWKALVGWLTVPPVVLLALVGLADVRRRPGAWLPWLAPLCGTLLTVVIFYGDTRMRTAADPTLLLLAASGVVLLVRAAARNSTASPESG